MVKKKMSLLILFILFSIIITGCQNKAFLNKNESSTDQTTNPAELYELGADYYYGENGKAQDYKRAVAYLTQSANAGNAKAQSLLGYCYEKGNGVAQDYSQALNWYLLAADQNDSFGQSALGYLYEKGYGGVKVDLETAKYWYGLAAAQGNQYAIDALNRLK